MVRVFKQYIPPSLIALALIESAILFFAVYAGFASWKYLHPNFSPELNSPLHWEAMVFVIIIVLSLVSMGLYQRRFRHGMAGMILRICTAFILGAVGITLIFYFIPLLLTRRHLNMTYKKYVFFPH